MIKAGLFILLCATSAQADSLGTTPRPEALVVFSKDIRMAARLIMAKGGALAGAVKSPAVIRLEAGFWTDAKATESVSLHCTARFVMADGSFGAQVFNAKCFGGALSETADSWTPLNIDLQFRPVITDPAGIMGVSLIVVDDYSGTQQTLTPTFDWQGGSR